MVRLIHFIYFASNGLLERWRRRFTPTGRALFILTFSLPAFLTGFESSSAFLGLALGLALLLFSFVFVPFFRGRFSIDRRLPPYATEGQLVRYTMGVKNLGSRAYRRIKVWDALKDHRLNLDEFREAAHPKKRVRSGSLAMSWPSRRRGISQETPVRELEAGERVEVELKLMPTRRGRLQIHKTLITRVDPLGLVRSHLAVTSPGSVTVLPRCRRVPELKWSGGGMLDQGVQTESTRFGDSLEFASLREYRPGDPPRKIHWRSWARLARPVVREHEAETGSQTLLWLDNTATLEMDSLFEEAVRIAATIVCRPGAQEGRVDQLIVGTQLWRVSEGSDHQRSARLMELLAGVQLDSKLPISIVESKLFKSIKLDQPVIAVLIDWDEARQNVIRHLLERGIRVSVVVVVWPDGKGPQDSARALPAFPGAVQIIPMEAGTRHSLEEVGE